MTEEQKSLLKQGTKVRFKWWGNKDLLYTGRIEVDKHGSLYFVNEHCYDGINLSPHSEGMRYYNPLSSFGDFTYFEIINPHI